MKSSIKRSILDNHTPKDSVGEYLRRQLTGGVETLRIVSAYFTVYAYERLFRELKQAKKVRFLYGSPSSVGEVDPGEKESKIFNLTESGLLPSQTLQQKRLAKDCEEWIKQRVDVRTIKKANFLHGKMYHMEQRDVSDHAVLGSSNFTSRGLGFNADANLELNLAVTEADTCNELKRWFDDIWRNRELTKDAKKDVLDALQRLGQNYSPELVYFKTLFEIFRDQVNARKEADDQLGGANLKDTQIWKTLYSFQRDGVAGIINRLKQYNGCILADSVGLGKTYTALAVIRYYEEKNQRVLVLCPKKLSENWKLYPAYFAQAGNPFKDDNFHYTVLHHSDLSRTEGDSNGIDLAQFDWASYGLVVIDESHNFRNESRSSRDKEGNIIRRSRYEKLLEDVIKAGGKTRVLMLSATPVNTSLIDLRNQIYFMTEKHEDAFKETLGISNFHATINVAQRKFEQWAQQSGDKNKNDLFESLGAAFFTLLDSVSLARSRRHVKNFYPEVVETIGGFPKQLPPQNETPPTDSRGELSYEKLDREIRNFKLAIYTPAAYVKSKKVRRELNLEKQKHNFNQADREHWLIGMIRVNFLKRLESAAPSLASTLKRTIDRIDQLIERIGEYKKNQENIKEVLGYDWEGEEAEDDEFIVSKARHPFYFRDLDLPRWLDDLQNDRDVLYGVYERVSTIKPERDGKLAALKVHLRNKLEKPTIDKDGRENRKVLVFTAFKDTAAYLYEQLKTLMEELSVDYAMVAGNETKATCGGHDFNKILTNFAPIGRGRFNRDEKGKPIPDGKPEIDVLIATDCVSEGQNLQDCDLVVNYDIHWNPVRLIQRFGRIDRIGSRNHQVRMINYWPTQELDYYLNLQDRVEARMVLVDAAATGDQLLTEGKASADAKAEVDFRNAQLRRLREEVLEFDDIDDGVSMSDFSLDDFLAQLMNYLQQNREMLEKTPFGVYAIANCSQRQRSVFPNLSSGVIFCLRQKNSPQHNQVRSPLKDYYLVYVRDDGEVRYNYTHAKQVLELFGELAHGQHDPLLSLCDAFDRETDNGRNMEKYNKLLNSVFSAVSEQYNRQETSDLSHRSGVLSKHSERPRGGKDFELVTWLVIKKEDYM